MGLTKISQLLNCIPRSSKFQSLDKFLEICDLPDTDTVHDSGTSMANQSKSSLQFNQSETSDDRDIGANFYPRPLSKKMIVVSVHHLPIRIKKSLS